MVELKLLIYLWFFLQEGAEPEEDAENNNEEMADAFVATEGEEKGDEQTVEWPRKTSKYMTKYERARILGTRALQIRFNFEHPVFFKTSFSISIRGEYVVNTKSRLDSA